MFKKVTFILFFLCICFLLNFIQAQQTNKIYLIGNSLTDCLNYDGYNSVVQSRGNVNIWARQTIPGSPLSYLWGYRTGGGFTVDPFGAPTNAFAVYQWDILSLQPFDRPIEGTDGDRAMVSNYYNLIKGKSPNCKVFIYAHWPRVPNGTDFTVATKDQYNSVWLDPNGMESRAYNENLTTTVRTDFPITKDNFIMVPLGEVLYALNNNQAFLDAAGITSIWKLYADGIHLTGMGSYIDACTMYAMAYHDDPAGLGVPGTFGSIPAAALPYIHQTIKDVIIAKSAFTKIDYFGVAPVKAISLNATAIELNQGATATLIPVFTPTNAGNKNISWTSSNDAVTSVNNGVVTAISVGTSVIKAKTSDGGFEATCTVSVINSGIAVTNISLNKTGTTILVGAKETLVANVLPAGASNKNVLWTTSDASIATVDASGMVTGIKKGSATIQVSSVNGLFSSSAVVTITQIDNPPVAVMKYTPGNSGYAPFKVTFDGRSSSDPDPNDFVLGFNWIISKQGVSGIYDQQSSNMFDKTFTEEGVYDVTFQASDNDQNMVSLNTEKVTINVLKMPTVSPNEKAICYEGFDYVNAAITNFNGGRGWREGWDLQNPTTNTASELGVTSTNPLVVSTLYQTGSHMILGQGYSGVGRGLDISTTGAFKDYINSNKIGKTGTTLWFSAIIRPQSNNKDCNISLSDEGITWLNNTENSHKVSFGSLNGNYWGVSFGNTNPVVSRSTVPVLDNTPAFLVAKIEFGSTNKITLYVNPTPGSFPLKDSVVATTNNSISFQAICMNFSSGSGRMSADEIRFGKSYNDVAPKLTSTAVLDVQGNDDEISTYPNPVVDKLTLNFGNQVEKVNVTIIDLQGRAIIKKSFANTKIESVDVRSLISGVYFIKVIKGNRILNSRFIKE